MDAQPTPLDADKVDEHVLELLRRVISRANENVEQDDVARALLFFVVRVGNTWRSIRTLRNHTPDQEGFVVDAGALLRVMFDAYLQAAYLVQDPDRSIDRARSYLEFEHVERFKRVKAVRRHDTPISRRLEESPKRQEGEERVKQEYDRVKANYFVVKNRKDGIEKRGPRTRNTWYEGDLAKIASTLGRTGEYDTLLAMFHGCVHSSAFAVGHGPLVRPEYVVDWASTVVARVAQLNVDHHQTVLESPYSEILDALCKPYF